MELSAKDAWTRLLVEARRELPDATVRTWLEPAEAIALPDGRLILGTPDQFAAEWNESKPAPLLSRLAAERLGTPVDIVFQVQEERARRPQMDFFVAPPPSETDAPARRRATPLNDRYTFHTFVIGKSNELAAAAAHAVAEAPAKTYNPLFIYGAPGPPRPRVAGRPRQDLQPALHLRRDRPGQDPSDAGDRARRAGAVPQLPRRVHGRRAVHQRGDREHPRSNDARLPPGIP